MGQKTALTNAYNIPIAEVEETDDTITLYNLQGGALGYYSKRDNTTRYMNGAFVGGGNLLGMLIPRT